MADFNYFAENDLDIYGILKGYSTTADEICFQHDYFNTELAKDMNECVQRASPYIDDLLELNFGDSVVNDCNLAQTYVDNFNISSLNSENSFEILKNANTSDFTQEIFDQENESEDGIVLVNLNNDLNFIC